MEERTQTPKKSKQRRSRLHFWILIPVVIGFIVVFFYAQEWKSRLVVERIIVDGAQLLTAKEIVTLTGIQPKTILESVVSRDVEEKLLRHPLIKSANVENQLPDAIRITVQERHPFAVASGKPLLYVDSEAVLLPRLPSMQFDLPLISGIAGIDTVRLGQQISSPEIFLAIAVLKQARQVGWYHSISEIKVAPDGEIMLFSMDSGVPILIGKDDVGNKLQRLQTFWKTYVKEGTASQLKYLDLRFDKHVVAKWDRPKNQITRIPL